MLNISFDDSLRCATIPRKMKKFLQRKVWVIVTSNSGAEAQAWPVTDPVPLGGTGVTNMAAMSTVGCVTPPSICRECRIVAPARGRAPPRQIEDESTGSGSRGKIRKSAGGFARARSLL